MTGNAAYLHRADPMMQLGVRLFFDETSPTPSPASQRLPKRTS